MLALASAGLAGGGCAPTTVTVQGRQLPRVEHAYTGQPFDVRHLGAHPQPGGASSGVRGYGGRITGNVCGLDIDYEVQHQGDHTRVSGFIDSGYFNSELSVRDQGGQRSITGTLGAAAGYSTVDLQLRSNELRGKVGSREYQLTQEGDQLVGTVRIGTNLTVRARLTGRDALWTLPAADQGAVLPGLLTCHGGALEQGHVAEYVVGVGGEPSREPPHTSSLYLHRR